MVASTVAVLTTIGIFLSVLFEALRFFQQVSVFEFLFGLSWSPQTAIRADQVGSSGAFGAVPLFAGTAPVRVRAAASAGVDAPAHPRTFQAAALAARGPGPAGIRLRAVGTAHREPFGAVRAAA